ncbi:MAG: hypothetical protein NC548_26800 [Lachnospiraceae bacterium]|nr:hypothetical protein [Lachnospiraceae bacterium]
MTEVICTAITAAATIICAFIAHTTSQREKREDERAEQRAKEGRLQLKMSEANNKLTIGVAMALKTGHANGEIEAGLKAVEDAQNDYRLFLEGMALDELKK